MRLCGVSITYLSKCTTWKIINDFSGQMSMSATITSPYTDRFQSMLLLLNFGSAAVSVCGCFKCTGSGVGIGDRWQVLKMAAA